jgi:GT2 family glycosyltransferase
MPIKVSVIVPTMTNGLSHLARLMPLLSQEKDCEIIVIDNNSKDGTTNYLSNYRCTIIVNQENVGFSKANNQAATIAQGEYLLLLNNDTTITPGFLAEMVKTFSLDASIGIVGCAIYTMDLPKKIIHAGVYFTPEFIPYELGLPVPGFSAGITNNDDRVSSVREVPSVTGACMMVRKSVWDEIGGLDEGYKNGWEDNDFVLKVREKGYTVWYTGKAQITHKKFGSHTRFAFEAQNRSRYDSIWVTSGKAKEILSHVAQ